MKRKIFLPLLLLAVFTFAGFKLCGISECWLRTERNGLRFELEYLHELAERQPEEARQYLGSSVTFRAYLVRMEKGIHLGHYGEFSELMVFGADGRNIFVDRRAAHWDESYEPGELLEVNGNITAMDSRRILILNVYGAPGYPNNIRVKRVES